VSVTKVFACDDDVSVGRMLQAVLVPEGYEVIFTTSGSDLLSRMSTVQPEAVILDRVMPGLGGMEVAARLRAQGYRGPIVLFSAFTGPDLEGEARALGVQPVPKEDLDALLGTLSGAAQPAPALG
jgi:CheY-like chemotaxis protein